LWNKLLSHTAGYTHYAIDNIPGGGRWVLMHYSGFTDSLKYKALSIPRATAGNGSASGNDIYDVVSSGPFSAESRSFF